MMNSAHQVQVDVYGAISVPERVYRNTPECLNFRGSVPRDQLFAAFDSADALVFPTLSDGFGMVVTEAFARGLPVITTPRAGAADLVTHAHNGLVIAPADARALAEAIGWCLDNRTLLAAMRQSALDTARTWQWSDYRRALRAAVSGAPIDTPSSRNMFEPGSGV
jgi:glycosyltransferase involved in cell wall biosynthesis